MVISIVEKNNCIRVITSERRRARISYTVHREALFIRDT